MKYACLFLYQCALLERLVYFVLHFLLELFYTCLRKQCLSKAVGELRVIDCIDCLCNKVRQRMKNVLNMRLPLVV